VAINWNKIKAVKCGARQNADSGVIYHPTDRVDYLGAVNPAPIFLPAAQLFLSHIHRSLEQNI